MENLKIYEAVRQVPKEAQKSIGGGRLKGMTDINPMWRIKTLTEQFGPCGFGWKYKIVDKWLDTTISGDEISVGVIIDLQVKIGDVWSEPIQGVGGSMLLTKEKNGLYHNDEAYKMALTDAISVACKALGMGADIYWQKDNTKYNDAKKEQATAEPKAETWRDRVIKLAKSKNISMAELAKDYELTGATTEDRFKDVYDSLKEGE